MRILVTGANGQVGHELLRALAGGGAAAANPHLAPRATLSQGETEKTMNPSPVGKGAGVRVRNWEVIPATRSGQLEDGTPCETIDLSDPGGLQAALGRIAPDLIINAGAYTAVDKAEDEPKLAQQVNAKAVRAIGVWAAQHGARVVHYSTDYVFDGTASAPYREDDVTHPVSAYGRSKLAGEIALCISGARYLIFRTAWVYAARGKNFLRTMLRLGAERDELRVVDDQVGVPTPAALIADVTVQAIARWYAEPDATSRQLDGLYHVVASGQTSWCGFARAIFERAAPTGDGAEAHPSRSPALRKEEPVKPALARARRKRSTATAAKAAAPAVASAVHPLPQEEGRRAAPAGCEAHAALLPHAPRVIAITTADYPTKAKRPAYSTLATTKLRDTFGIALPDWQTALDGVMDELAAGLAVPAPKDT
ncbi:MAG TPA: dTDP-4-dehydrorhamnose reductase [Rhodanobacteraceae bacterium]